MAHPCSARYKSPDGVGAGRAATQRSTRWSGWVAIFYDFSLYILPLTPPSIQLTPPSLPFLPPRPPPTYCDTQSHRGERQRLGRTLRVKMWRRGWRGRGGEEKVASGREATGRGVGWGGRQISSFYDALPKLKSNQSERPEGGPRVLSQSFRACQSPSG